MHSSGATFTAANIRAGHLTAPKSSCCAKPSGPSSQLRPGHVVPRIQRSALLISCETAPRRPSTVDASSSERPPRSDRMGPRTGDHRSHRVIEPPFPAVSTMLSPFWRPQTPCTATYDHALRTCKKPRHPRHLENTPALRSYCRDLTLSCSCFCISDRSFLCRPCIRSS